MFSRQTILFAVFWLGAFIMAACSQIPGVEDLPGTGGTEAAPDGEAALANTQWVLESYGPPGAEMPVVGDTPITIEFDDQGGAAGSGGCNSFSSAYMVEDGQLNFNDIISTLIACEEAGIGEQEQQFFSALETAGEYEISGDRLVISYAGGEGVLNFVRANGE